MTKRQPLGQTARSKRVDARKTDPDVVERILAEVKNEDDSPVSDKSEVMKPSTKSIQAPKDERYKLTGYISKDLFRRMKMHCAANDLRIREFLESAISSALPE